MFKLIKFLIKLAISLALLLALAMAVLFVIAKTYPDPGSDFNAVIILGAQVKEDGTLSIQLEDRLKAGLALWQKNRSALIITCGGRAGTEPIAEGEAMKRFLVNSGVPDNQVLAETQSANTKENIRLALSILREELPGGVIRPVIVTSDYHVPRAVRIARDEGIAAGGAGSATRPEWFLKNYAREVLAWGKYFLMKVMPNLQK